MQPLRRRDRGAGVSPALHSRDHWSWFPITWEGKVAIVKIVKLLIAILAALWTLGVVVGVVSEFGKHGGTRGVAQFAAQFAAIAFCVAVTACLFSWALKTPGPPPTS